MIVTTAKEAGKGEEEYSNSSNLYPRQFLLLFLFLLIEIKHKTENMGSLPKYEDIVL